ncbi:MAG TPA: PEP-CTERM sorting domain-containing protein [Tepidisphaeraceae bacterium]|jgi:hypothetical protein
MRPLIQSALVAASMFSLPALAAAAIFIQVGDYNLERDRTDQTISIFVTGETTDQVQGLNFYAQVADGGPGEGGVIDGPDILAADIITNTIFAGNSNPQQDPGSTAQLVIRTTTTASGTVRANGLLATLTIDTRGFTAGQSFELRVGDTLAGNTNFAGTPAGFDNGTITITNPVPEPTALAMLGLAALGLRRRTRRA